MRVPNHIRFSHFKPVYLESIKIICLHVTSRAGMWIKMYEKGVEIPLMKRLNARVVETLKGGA